MDVEQDQELCSLVPLLVFLYFYYVDAHSRDSHRPITLILADRTQREKGMVAAGSQGRHSSRRLAVSVRQLPADVEDPLGCGSEG